VSKVNSTLYLLFFCPLSIQDVIISLPVSSDNVIMYLENRYSSSEHMIIWIQSPAFIYNFCKICSG